MTRSIQIVDFKEEYAEAISNIVTRNLLEINSKDYGMEQVKLHALNFTPEKIREYSRQRTIFVALADGAPAGTLSVCRDIYGGENDYMFLTIFVLPECHGRGIGKLLILHGEEYIRKVHGKKVTIPASLYGHVVYHKLGYSYVNGTQPNEEGCIMMAKSFGE